MLTVSQSVGEKGNNLRHDVLNVQKALNKVKPALMSKRLLEDGVYGKNTAEAIRVFQQKHVLLKAPDGRIDPLGKTINKLNQILAVTAGKQKLLFPLDFKPAESYNSGMRAFGVNRSKGARKHAGVDLYAVKGTPIRAMADGKVVQEYAFYLGTRALEVDHGEMILRYCEISHVAPGIKKGESVKRGQVIAYVGQLVFKDGLKMSMLHLEAYKGTMTGPLTVQAAKPYQRRADLFDPTTMLDGAVMQ
jgi:murein DD-endopeptidase MepM/ murein hydrolase activator NlpD